MKSANRQPCPDTRKLVVEAMQEHPDWGANRIAAHIGCTMNSAAYHMRCALEENAGLASLWNLAKNIRARASRHGPADKPAPEGPRLGISSEFGSDDGLVSSLHPRIRTVEQLLKASEVDMTVWEIERHLINKWEVGRKDKQVDLAWADGRATGTVKDSGEIFVEPLLQVKIWLRRKTPVVRSIETLIATIESNPPKWPSYPRPSLRGLPKRSLEVSIMDLHLGLDCRKPESDAPWNMELAERFLFQAVESLLERAKPFGPFAEVFMPFGNDWVHCDTVFHTTTAGTGQPEAIDWHRVWLTAERLSIALVNRLREVAPVVVKEIPGNHSRQTDFALARLLKAKFSGCSDVNVDASSSPYKFHRCGVNLIGFEHGHSVQAHAMAALMANERPDDWSATKFREWHLGDQHRKASGKPSTFEEQGVSVEYLPSLVPANAWHRLKGFNHQKRGAMAFVWDHTAGPLARLQYNVLQHEHAIQLSSE